MDMMADTYLRRGKRNLRRFVQKPGISGLLWAAGYGLGGFLISAAGIRQSPQPIAMGMVSALSGWQALMMTLGSMAGYGYFWGRAGLQGVFWSAAGGLLALVGGRQKGLRQRPLLLALLASALTAGLGLLFQTAYGEETALPLYGLRILVAGLSALLACYAFHQRDSLTDWLLGGVLTLSFAQVMPIPYLGLGYAAAGLISVRGPFPAAVLAGLGLDLARITPIPMTAVMCGAYLLEQIPFSERWLKYLAPAGACLGVMLLGNYRDPIPLPGLILGGGLGLLLPGRPELQWRRGPTGAAQVRLELSAGAISGLSRILREQSEPAPDRRALLLKARQRACGGCPDRENCPVRTGLTPAMLQKPLELTCSQTGRLLTELRRGQEQWKLLLLERRRREEFRKAVLQQYDFLSRYLRSLSDQMPRRGRPLKASFCIQISARSRARQQVNGDCCLAFPGVGCRYYLLLCDGMGTGPGAAEEGKQAAELIKKMLISGLPPEFALQNLNSLLTLRGQAGASTVDLVEVRLDTGRAAVYKWGAAPSWLVRSGRAEKIGTATPPPGISVEETRKAVLRLSLSRGEVLVLFSDGVDGEAALGRVDWTPDVPPGELAETLLERGCGQAEDDATAAVLRLRPTSLAT